jgi:hypothetical protein
MAPHAVGPKRYARRFLALQPAAARFLGSFGKRSDLR